MELTLDFGAGGMTHLPASADKQIKDVYIVKFSDSDLGAHELLLYTVTDHLY
jgi:hypothetical protein